MASILKVKPSIKEKILTSQAVAQLLDIWGGKEDRNDQ